MSSAETGQNLSTFSKFFGIQILIAIFGFDMKKFIQMSTNLVLVTDLVAFEDIASVIWRKYFHFLTCVHLLCCWSVKHNLKKHQHFFCTKRYHPRHSSIKFILVTNDALNNLRLDVLLFKL